MAALTPTELTALEMLVGVRAPSGVTQQTLQSLLDGGWCALDRYGQVVPTDIGVRATAPQHMKDITPWPR